MSLQAPSQQYVPPAPLPAQPAHGWPRITDIHISNDSKEMYLKAFLMDDSVNQNFWKIPTTAMKKYASSFIGKPLVYHPSGQHIPYLKEGIANDSPTFLDEVIDVQDRYKIGEIMYVNQQHIKEQPNKKAWYATIRVTNPDIVKRIKSGEISSFVSPQVYDLNGAAPNEETTDFVPLHLAVVNAPAYGNKARIRASCTGTGSSCVNALKSACSCGCNGNVATSNIINNHSSLLKNSSNETNRSTMVNPTYRDPTNEQQQLMTQSGFNPYNNPTQGSYYDPNNNSIQQQQLLAQKTQTQEIDANGNLVTKTEDKKPSATNKAGKQQQQQQQPTATSTAEQPQPTATGTLINYPVPPLDTQQPQNPVSTGNSNSNNLQSLLSQQQNPVVPNEILEAIKGMKAEYMGITERLNQIENFKKTAEDDKMRQASEAQRKIIESVFTPEVIADENARQDIIEKFVSLPLNDEQLKMVLDLITTGTFSTAAQPPKQPAAAAQPPKRPAFGGGGNVKGAAVMNTLSISKPRGTDPYRGASAISLNSRIFGDLNVENL